MIFEQKLAPRRRAWSPRNPGNPGVFWALGAIAFDFEECPLGSFPSNLIHEFAELPFFFLYDSTPLGQSHGFNIRHLISHSGLIQTSYYTALGFSKTAPCATKGLPTPGQVTWPQNRYSCLLIAGPVLIRSSAHDQPAASAQPRKSHHGHSFTRCCGLVVSVVPLWSLWCGL